LKYQITDPNNGAINSLIYDYSPTAQTLTRTLGARSSVLLSNCTSLQFSIFQRNPIGGSYDQYPVDDPSRPDLCKLVQLTWVCQRSVMGRIANTESVQSAKVVMRKP